MIYLKSLIIVFILISCFNLSANQVKINSIKKDIANNIEDSFLNNKMLNLSDSSKKDISNYTENFKNMGIAGTISFLASIIGIPLTTLLCIPLCAGIAYLFVGIPYLFMGEEPPNLLLKFTEAVFTSPIFWGITGGLSFVGLVIMIVGWALYGYNIKQSQNNSLSLFLNNSFDNVELGLKIKI